MEPPGDPPSLLLMGCEKLRGEVSQLLLGLLQRLARAFGLDDIYPHFQDERGSIRVREGVRVDLIAPPIGGGPLPLPVCDG
jgi:hypothetical protein